MATVLKRKLKDGSLSYRIQVRIKNKGTGNPETKVTTWRAPKHLNGRDANKEALKYSLEFEEEVKRQAEGLTGIQPTIKLQDYTKIWLDQIQKRCAPSYHASSRAAVDKINRLIGNYALNEITPLVVQKFIDTMQKMSLTKVLMKTNKLEKILQKKKLSYMAVERMTGFNASTIANAAMGKLISEESGKAIAKAIGCRVNELFSVINESKPVQSGTVTRHYRVLRAILSVAKKQQIIKENYAKSEYIMTIKDPKKPIKILDDKSAKKFAEGLWQEEDIRIKTALLILLFTGLRRGELCGLEWQDIDFENGELRVCRSSMNVARLGMITKEPKTANSIREISMPSSLTLQLKEYKKWWDDYIKNIGDRYDGNNRLFITHEGTPLYPSTIRYWLDRVTKKLGLPNISVHSLRHTNITVQLMAGIPMKTVSSRAGHSNIRITSDVYGHFLKSSDKEAAEKINSMFAIC